jgi:hypothetical protein
MASINTAGGGSVRSIFPKGPGFTLDNFSNKDFIVRDFVEELAENAVPANRRSGPAQQVFDAKPLIRAFESRSICPWYSTAINVTSRCAVEPGFP